MNKNQAERMFLLERIAATAHRVLELAEIEEEVNEALWQEAMGAMDNALCLYALKRYEQQDGEGALTLSPMVVQ